MNAPLTFGYIAFFGIPLLLWIIPGVSARLAGTRHPLLAVIGGSDGRLSLSRLQALVWTTVVFGAFSAAMVVSNKVTDQTWVQIPEPLLQLTGIAIAASVISSLMAGTSGESRSVEITGLDMITDPAHIIIQGNDFGNPGMVRFGSKTIKADSWDDNQIKIAKSELTGSNAKRLIVDTANGKACYLLNGIGPDFQLGEPTTYYELIDLFRTDQSPTGLDLMKLQMFGWTVIAVGFYVVLFLSRLSAEITSLPKLDQNIVILTGLSQAGYLTGKGASAAGSS